MYEKAKICVILRRNFGVNTSESSVGGIMKKNEIFKIKKCIEEKEIQRIAGWSKFFKSTTY